MRRHGHLLARGIQHAELQFDAMHLAVGVRPLKALVRQDRIRVGFAVDLEPHRGQLRLELGRLVTEARQRHILARGGNLVVAVAIMRDAATSTAGATARTNEESERDRRRRVMCTS